MRDDDGYRVKRLALFLVLLVFATCNDGERPRRADETAPAATGYVLPSDRPASCELATGRFQEKPPRPSFGAVLSPKGLDATDEIDSIQVSVEPAAKDREISADEEKINVERNVGGKRVRIVKAMGTAGVDWWEDGWRVTVSARDAREEFAVDTAAGVTVPPAGGEPQDTKIDVPESLAMIATVTDRRESAGYTISTSRCGDREPELVTVIVHFIEGGVDPRVVALPGRSERRSDDGRDYWVHADRGGISWSEGPAVASVVTAQHEPALFDYARSLRRVSREDVAEWIAEAETQMRG
jgi:hypothetical protein